MQVRRGYLSLRSKAVPLPDLTWHHAVEGDCALADEVLADGVMIPHKETHQGQLWHVDCEHQSLLPHRVEPYRTVPRGWREDKRKYRWKIMRDSKRKNVTNKKGEEVGQIKVEERKSSRDGGQREWTVKERFREWTQQSSIIQGVWADWEVLLVQVCSCWAHQL